MARREAAPGQKKSVNLSPYAQILSRRGRTTDDAVRLLAKTLEGSLFQADRHFRLLVQAMDVGWPDTESAAVISAIMERLESGDTLDWDALQRWILVHQGDSGKVRECMFANPPEGVSILKVLSDVGGQKLVFLASWQIAQREVVLKKFRGPAAATRILQREAQAHPLSMAHPNIIETHILRSNKGEDFLVERCLPLVLSDGWKSKGLQEAANLLRDIASALAFLDDQGLVHGDIKPDNIGFENGRYILLDFGICRPRTAFDADTTPTGSLRTRAPELILREAGHTHWSDIWALGASIFNTVAGHFPLLDPDEKPPRVSDPEERGKFEELLRNRVLNEWSKRTDLSLIHEPLRPLLGRMLERNAESRMGAHEIFRQAQTELSAVLRFTNGAAYISPSQEIEQLK